MIKQELKTGMVVEFNNGDKFVVMKNSDTGDTMIIPTFYTINTNKLYRGRFRYEFDEFTDDLRSVHLNKSFDVRRVLDMGMNVVWDRELEDALTEREKRIAKFGFHGNLGKTKEPKQQKIEAPEGRCWIKKLLNRFCD